MDYQANMNFQRHKHEDIARICCKAKLYIDGLVQDCSISITDALEIRQSYT